MAKKTPDQSHLSYAVAVARILLGSIFLWAFLDKLFGLYATPVERAWLQGGSPTTGFLKGVEGPFGSYFQSMAGQAWVDWLFMLGLFSIGLGLICGLAMRITVIATAIMLIKLYAASLPPENNPLIDDHVIYFALLMVIALYPEQKLSLQSWWRRLPVIERYRWLQ